MILELNLVSKVFRHFHFVTAFDSFPLGVEAGALLLGPVLVAPEIVRIEGSVDVAIEWAWVFKVLVIDLRSKGWVDSEEAALAVVLGDGFPQELLVLGSGHLLQDCLMLEVLWLLFDQAVD